jgi:hypothetical protein
MPVPLVTRVRKAVVIMDVKVVVVNVTKLVLQIAIASHLIIARDPVDMIVIFVILFVVRIHVLADVVTRVLILVHIIVNAVIPARNTNPHVQMIPLVDVVHVNQEIAVAVVINVVINIFRKGIVLEILFMMKTEILFTMMAVIL